LWVAAVTPALHYSMGGLNFSASAEVRTAASGKPIRRLYAAGEVTGGLFGGNRLGDAVAGSDDEQADAQGAAVGRPLRALFLARGTRSDNARPAVE